MTKQKAVISHVKRLTVYVSDIAQSQQFYEEILGLRHTNTVGPQPHPLHPNRQLVLCFMECADQHRSLVLARQTDMQGTLIPVKTFGLMHMAFELKQDYTPQEFTEQVLKEKHIPIAYGPVTHKKGLGGDGGLGGNTAVYFPDPDGHLVEVYCCMDSFQP